MGNNSEEMSNLSRSHNGGNYPYGQRTPSPVPQRSPSASTFRQDDNQERKPEISLPLVDEETGDRGALSLPLPPSMASRKLPELPSKKVVRPKRRAPLGPQGQCNPLPSINELADTKAQRNRLSYAKSTVNESLYLEPSDLLNEISHALPSSSVYGHADLTQSLETETEKNKAFPSTVTTHM